MSAALSEAAQVGSESIKAARKRAFYGWGFGLEGLSFLMTPFINPP
jgi:hypothetical protein